jgi:hypothetical protein
MLQIQVKLVNGYQSTLRITSDSPHGEGEGLVVCYSSTPPPSRPPAAPQCQVLNGISRKHQYFITPTISYVVDSKHAKLSSYLLGGGGGGGGEGGTPSVSTVKYMRNTQSSHSNC